MSMSVTRFRKVVLPISNMTFFFVGQKARPRKDACKESFAFVQSITQSVLEYPRFNILQSVNTFNNSYVPKTNYLNIKRLSRY